jgi:hypothetical protein
MNETARRARVQQLGDSIGRKCDEIAKLFTEPVFVTVIVRNPAHPGGARDSILSTEKNPAEGLRAGFSLLQDQTSERYER